MDGPPENEVFGERIRRRIDVRGDIRIAFATRAAAALVNALGDPFKGGIDGKSARP
jgi:hypothetical protein